jgi:hypothetical protein
MATSDDVLIEQALKFLRGSKTSEALSVELRRVLYAPVLSANQVRLDQTLVDALRMGRDVFVAGTAGGGKTMLVDQIIEQMISTNKKILIVDDDDTSSDTRADLVVVRDLTAVGPEAFLRFFQSKNRPPFLIAANEGALMDQALGGLLDSVINDLHAMQNGLGITSDGPVVVDMAAIDPLGDALASLLANELLHEACRAAAISQDESPDGPRISALMQLKDPDRARAVARLVQLALGPGEVTFREVWNFIADLFLGGSDEDSPPTSVWFWRIFFGDSSLSARLREILRPEHLSLPDFSFSLFRGDFLGLDLSDKQQNCWVHPGEDPIRLDGVSQKELMRWLRLQRVFLDLEHETQVASLPFVGGFTMKFSELAFQKKGAVEIAYAINNYFKGQHLENGQFNGLELWVDLMVERRQDRGPLVSLGRVPSISLSIRKSYAISRTQGFELPGSRVFLHATNNNQVATLELSAEFSQVISRGRSTRTFDRYSDDVDLALRKFFFGAASKTTLDQIEILRILHVDEDESMREISWNVDKKFRLLRA